MRRRGKRRTPGRRLGGGGKGMSSSVKFRQSARPWGPRVRSSRAAASKIRRGSRPGGRPAIPPPRQKARCGPERVANGEAQVTQRPFVGVDAQDLAQARRSSAPDESAAAGGGRVGAQKRVDKARPAPAKNRGSPSPALPLARAQAGIVAAETLHFRRILSGPPLAVGLAERRRTALATVGSSVGEQVRVGANHWRMGIVGGALSPVHASYPPRLS